MDDARREPTQARSQAIVVMREAAAFIEELVGVDLLPEEELEQGRQLTADLRSRAEDLAVAGS
jgi:hypothetical protein